MKKMIFILLFISLTCSVCETFEVRSAQSFYQVFKNGDITLEWTFTNSSLDSLYISCFAIIDLKHQALLKYDKGVQSPLDGPFKGRVQLDKDVLREGRIRLHVSSLRTEESGDYECEVKTSEGSDWDQCGVSVKETFEVRSAQSFYQVSKNEEVTLEWTFTNSSLDSLQIFCYVFIDHHPSDLCGYFLKNELPQSGLFKGRVQLDKDVLREGRIRLHVSSIRTEDSGEYSCEVGTREGFGSASCNVTVTDKLQTTPETRTGTGPEPEDRNTWSGVWICLSVGLSAAVLCVGVLLYFFLSKRKLAACYIEDTGGKKYRQDYM